MLAKGVSCFDLGVDVSTRGLRIVAVLSIQNSRKRS
jgi:hypothetical protein